MCERSENISGRGHALRATPHQIRSTNLAPPQGGSRDVDYDAANFISLIASKFCTPPPTRLVV